VTADGPREAGPEKATGSSRVDATGPDKSATAAQTPADIAVFHGDAGPDGLGALPRAGRWARAVRIAITVTFLLLLVGLVARQYELRNLEARAAATVFRLGTPTLAASHAPIVYFGLGGTSAFGLTITPECSSTLLVAPVLLLGAALLWSRRMTVGRVLAAISVTAVILVAGNQLRIGLIAYLISLMGFRTGYEWGHLVFGSLVSIVFIGFSLILFVMIVMGGRRADGQPA
jgi:exosortase/archaeosortase family protein